MGVLCRVVVVMVNALVRTTCPMGRVQCAMRASSLVVRKPSWGSLRACRIGRSGNMSGWDLFPAGGVRG
jgi:hypothetical protein